ncbi:hypothetical protein CEB3_c37310 [Peptococcaceae bacterium CEB3]|nr:hypothetical protein CEB3_c37310 [Peptococcaceae bacterium CEB3]
MFPPILTSLMTNIHNQAIFVFFFLGAGASPLPLMRYQKLNGFLS